MAELCHFKGNVVLFVWVQLFSFESNFLSSKKYPHVYILATKVELKSHSWQDVLNTTLCDKVCQWFATGQCFSPDTSVSSTNKTDHHDITEILLKVVLNTINQPN